MTIEDIKADLSAAKLPTNIKLSAWEQVEDVETFLATTYQLIEQAEQDYKRTPAWDRLVRLHQKLSL